MLGDEEHFLNTIRRDDLMLPEDLADLEEYGCSSVGFPTDVMLAVVYSYFVFEH